MRGVVHAPRQDVKDGPDVSTSQVHAAASDSRRPAAPLLKVRGLHTRFYGQSGTVHAVRGASFDVAAGETVALVGESGSGKSAAAMSILGLLPDGARNVVAGSIEFEGQELRRYDERQMRDVRGRRIGVVFQDASTALNPVLTVGTHLREALDSHEGSARTKVRERALLILEQVGFRDPARIYKAYPHELSGGMKQRAMIAIALMAEPSLIIADEPTTALDVTIQAQILDLMASLSAQMGVATLLITHDMGVVARYADRTYVMYAGEIVEGAPTRELFRNPRHPYTRALLRSVPSLTERTARMETIAGAPPELAPPPPGCAFAPRCAFAQSQCWSEAQSPEVIARDHTVSCGVRPAFPPADLP